jgi:hypothetical protein
MRIRIHPLVIWGLLTAAASFGQPIQVGSLQPGANVPMGPAPVTVFDWLAHPPSAGVLSSVTFAYSASPCPAAVKIKFFRTFGIAMRLLAERGPFDVTQVVQTVALSPPVAVLTSDWVAITKLSNCGSPLAASTGAGILASFPGDIGETIINASNLTSGLTLSLAASGTQVPFDGVTAVIPVAFDGLGAGGSVFHTETLLYNPTGVPVSGWFLITNARSINNRFFVTYDLPPYQTRTVNVGGGMFSNIDIVPIVGTSPRASVYVFNDLGQAGTLGFTAPDVTVAEALASGERGALLAPSDPSNFRMNIGVRGIPSATLVITVRSQDGTIVTTKSQGAGILIQQSAQDLLGVPLQPNMTITFEVTSGTAVIYGVTADNRTNDTSFQLARRSTSDGALPSGKNE